MTKAAEELFERVIRLEPSDRAELIDRLSAAGGAADGADEPQEPGYAQAWAAEVLDRKAQVERGEETPIPWQESVARARRQVTGGG